MATRIAILSTGWLLLVFSAAASLPIETAAQEIREMPPDDLWAEIMEEATQRTQVLDTLIELSDVRGPRLLGTRNYYDAAVWSRDALRTWGIEARLDQLEENYRGWEANMVAVSLLEPAGGPLAAFPVAWSGSTPGPIFGTPLAVNFGSLDDLKAVKQYGDAIRGRILLLQPTTTAAPNFEATAERWQAPELARAGRSDDPTPVSGFYYTPRSSFHEALSEALKVEAKRRKVQLYLSEHGVAAVLIPSRFTHGLLYVGATPFIHFNDPKPVPQIVIANEHAQRLHRLIERGITPEIRVESTNQFVEKPAYNVNVLGEIKGSRNPEEFVLVGAHLDSEVAGSGAIDNGTGSAVMLESMRILSAIGARPDRSIRIALWAGEEQGYIGSLDYAAKYIGDIMTGSPGPRHEAIVAYLNLDHGTGRIRGVYLQGNSAWRSLFEQILAPFQFAGASTITLESTTGTDHVVFDALNVPAFQFVQDLINLDTVTGHTNLDSVDHALEEDLQINAAIIAAAALHIANSKTIPSRRDRVPEYRYTLPD